MENAQWPSLVDAPVAGGAGGGGLSHSVPDAMVVVPLDGSNAASGPNPASATGGLGGATAGGLGSDVGGAPGQPTAAAGSNA